MDDLGLEILSSFQTMSIKIFTVPVFLCLICGRVYIIAGSFEKEKERAPEFRMHSLSYFAFNIHSKPMVWLLLLNIPTRKLS